MGGPVVDEAKVARIQKLRREGMSINEIAAAEQVSTGSVRRYTNPRYREVSNEASAAYRRRGGRLTMLERAERDRRDRRPLYNPRDHQLWPMSDTAEFCGDPRPGRRELVANAPEPSESQRRQPWRPTIGLQAPSSTPEP